MNSVYIEITNVCNLHCSFCPWGKQGGFLPRNFMTEKLFERCISEAATVAEQVYFHVLGEPTLHSHFELFLKKMEQVSCAENGGNKLQLNLTTNGTTIDRCGKALLASPAVRQVNFSTHAYAELPFEEAAVHLKNVLDFCKVAATERPDMYINLRLWNAGDESSKGWNNYMLEQVNFFAQDTAGKNGKAHEPITLEHFCSRHKSFLVDGRIYIPQDSRFEWPPANAAPAEKIIKGNCRALDTHCAILCDGRVVACCLDYSGQITLGHIQQNSLAEILNSPAALNIGEGFARQELRHPFCQSCTFCKRFK